jgi:hypothetical protein
MFLIAPVGFFSQLADPPLSYYSRPPVTVKVIADTTDDRP